MATYNISQEEVMAQVQQIIADLTGNDIADIMPQTQLEEELGITPIDFRRLVAEINKQFEIDLDARSLIEEEVSTVKELVLIATEEAILG